MDYRIELIADRLAHRLRMTSELSNSVSREHLRTVARNYVTDPDDNRQLEVAAMAAVDQFPMVFQANHEFKVLPDLEPMTASEREADLKATGLI